MTEQKVNRRLFCQVLGSGLYVLGSTMAWGNSQESEAGPPDIIIRRNYSYGRFYFDPAGLYVQPGTTIRWENNDWGFTVTAFHPSNDNRELRIPENAQPFDSGLMIDGGSFEWKFDLEGTYDYFSRYHETIGCVARIVVGRPGGPGEKPPGYGGREGRAPMFKASRQLLEYLKSSDIVQKKKIPYPLELMKRPFPNFP